MENTDTSAKANSADTVNVTAPAMQPEADEKFVAAVGYFGFLFVVPLIVKPKSSYCKFHAKQSMALFILMLVVFFILYVIPALGSILTLGLFAVYVLAIYKAYSGDQWIIPYLSNLTGKINVDALYNKAGLAVSNIQGLKEKAVDAAQQAGNAVQNITKQVGEPEGLAKQLRDQGEQPSDTKK